jgi:hypothetical protein
MLCCKQWVQQPALQPLGVDRLHARKAINTMMAAATGQDGLFVVEVPSGHTVRSSWSSILLYLEQAQGTPTASHYPWPHMSPRPPFPTPRPSPLGCQFTGDKLMMTRTC